MSALRTISRNRSAVIVGSFIVYIAGYFLLRPMLGVNASALVMFPVVLSAWRFGLRTGLIALAAAIVITIFLTAATGDADPANPQFWLTDLFGSAILLIFTVALGTLHELGARQKHELERRQKNEQIEHQRNAELEALHRASLLLTSTLELKPVLLTIMEQVTALLTAPEVHIFLYDAGELSFGAAYWDGQERDAPLRVPRPDGLTATVARTRQRMIINDMSTNPMMQGRNWTGASISVPLAIGEQVYGVMNVSFDEPRSFSDSEIRIIELFADQATLALRNARAYENTRQYAEVLEQRVAERTAELLRAKESAEALLNNSFDVILRLTAEGAIQQINPAFVRVFGIADGEGRSFSSLFQDAEAITAALQAVVTERTIRQLEATALREGGQFITDLVFVPLDSAGAGLEIICNLRDVTERKHAEIRQQALVTGQRKVLALAYELVSSPDMDGLWKRAVEKARTELGIERCSIFVERGNYMHGTYGTNLLGETTDEHEHQFFKGERTWEKLEHVFTLDSPAWGIEYNPHQEWDGEKMADLPSDWVAVTPIHSAYRFIGIFYNDTAISRAPLDEIQQEILSMYCSFLGSLYEHKRVEDEVRRALEREKELSELKSRFTSMISHELRTPLSSIQLSSDLLKRYGDRLNHEATVAHIDKIQAQVKHLTNLLEDVLTFTRGEGVGLQPQLRPVDLRGFCAELATEVGVTHSTHTVVFKDCAGNWVGSVDPKLMRQALLNLLLNAIKYSPPQTIVTLSLDREDKDAIIRVQDQGIGIPEADLAHIFDVFYRAKNVGAVSGTGLGLALVQQIAEAHHGFVFCESQVNLGTTFTLRIPAF